MQTMHFGNTPKDDLIAALKSVRRGIEAMKLLVLSDQQGYRPTMDELETQLCELTDSLPEDCRATCDTLVSRGFIRIDDDGHIEPCHELMAPTYLHALEFQRKLTSDLR